jgi:hypothetical protein
MSIDPVRVCPKRRSLQTQTNSNALWRLSHLCPANGGCDQEELDPGVATTFELPQTIVLSCVSTGEFSRRSRWLRCHTVPIRDLGSHFVRLEQIAHARLVKNTHVYRRVTPVHAANPRR